MDPRWQESSNQKIRKTPRLGFLSLDGLFHSSKTVISGRQLKRIGVASQPRPGLT
jgi:hypothetical protein